MNENDNIKVIKLVTGEEVVARIKDGPDNIVSLDSPYIVQLNEEGIALFPWILTAKSSELVNIAPLSVVSIANPKEKIIQGYKEVIKDDVVEDVAMEFEDDLIDFVNTTVH
jgi:hypothetical protein